MATNWTEIIKLLMLGGGVFLLLQIAMQPGLYGKVFVIVVIGILYYVWMRINNEGRAPNHLNTYHDRLKKLCKLKGPGGLRMVKMMGDAANGWYIKGKILGGPVYEWNHKLDPRDPKYCKMLFLYTPDYRGIYTLPIISWIMINFRREILIAVFHNKNADDYSYVEVDKEGKEHRVSVTPISQLKNPVQMRSKDPLDHVAKMIGDLEIRGINTYFVREIEYINDEIFNIDAEMLRLAENVDRLTLEDNLENLPNRIKHAIDSNSDHQRLLDTKDFIGGSAKVGEAS
jgi:hypothetical protein